MDVCMTNKKGIKYCVTVTRECTEVLEVWNVKYERYHCLKDAPKWVQKTAKEQLPIVVGMLEKAAYDFNKEGKQL